MASYFCDIECRIGRYCLLTGISLKNENEKLLLSIFSLREVAAGFPWDNFENLGSNFPPMGKYVVSKIPVTCHQIFYLILLEFPDEVSN